MGSRAVSRLPYPAMKRSEGWSSHPLAAHDATWRSARAQRRFGVAGGSFRILCSCAGKVSTLSSCRPRLSRRPLLAPPNNKELTVRRFARAIAPVVLALGAIGAVPVGLVLTAGPASATATATCPNVNLNTTGCAYVINIDANGKASISPGGGTTYDGSEDIEVGVQNNSSGTLSSLTLSGTTPIFGFDNDGICSYSSYSSTHGYCSSATTGYEGPDNTFSGISADKTSGTVVFNTGSYSSGLTPGGANATVVTGVTLTVGPITATEGGAFNGQVASFTDGFSAPTGYTATIDW